MIKRKLTNTIFKAVVVLDTVLTVADCAITLKKIKLILKKY